ncbi:MAG: DegT/DnrJ/EryC1/StrS aminotransferase family protein [Termitinemataceae bacterium]|nr:MAG: DegT/DnrJ/EryC1/StrS aminotransferase family protein [Termitinemataceae bacterium]
MTIPFALPYIGSEEEEAVLKVLRSGWLTTSKEALNFEKEFSEFIGARHHALAVNSATSGLHLSLEACGVRSGDVVLVPSCTFASDAEAVRYLGADIAFIDSESGGFNLDPCAVEDTLKRLAAGRSAYKNGGPKGRAAAIIAVHFGGLPCEMQRIKDAASEYGVPVIEDCAHAFPAFSADGRTAGTIGDIGVFSFYATKTITTGEGGMIVTANKEMAERMQVMRLHGIDRPVWNRYNAASLTSVDKKPSWHYEVVESGFKYNLCDILASIGRVQLKRASWLLGERKKIAAFYDFAFEKNESFVLPPTALGNAYHLYPLRLNSKKCRLTRDELIEKLKENGIGTSVHFIPLHTMPYYKKLYGFTETDFPVAYDNFLREVSLPIFPGMSDDQTEYIISVITSALQ